MNPCWPLHKWEGWTDGHAIWCGEKCSFLWDGKGLRVLYKKIFLGKAWHCLNMSGEHKGNMPLQRPLGSHEFWGCGKCEFPWSNSKSRILGSQGLALFGHGHLGCITFYPLVLWWDGWAGLYTTSSYLQIPWDTPVNKDRNRNQDLLKDKWKLARAEKNCIQFWYCVCLRSQTF